MNQRFDDVDLLSAFMTEEYLEILGWAGLDHTRDEDRIQLAECLKYLYLCSVYGGGFIPVSPEIDEVWHKMILQTKHYARLCEELPGRRFIHHETLPFLVYAGQEDHAAVVKAFARWIPLYNHHFSGLTDASLRYWGFADFLVKSGQISLAQLNQVV